MAELAVTPKYEFGRKIYYVQNAEKFSIIQNENNGKYFIRILVNGTWQYPQWACAGFMSIDDALSYLERHDWENANIHAICELVTQTNTMMEELELGMNLLGFHIVDDFTVSMDTICWEWLGDSNKGQLHIRLYICDGFISNECTLDGQPVVSKLLPTSIGDIGKMVRKLELFFKRLGVELFSNIVISSCSNRQEAITAAINTRDLAKDIVHVKSSNVWGYNINIRDRKSKFGDVLVQFKGNKGGPGDIYMYYDVPIVVYRRWHTAPSKGHYFWRYIRNIYNYSKLTGDKRGKLKNAIN